MTQVSDIIVNWTSEESGRVASIQIQSRIAGTSEWTEQAAAHDPFVGEFRFTANAPATDVEVRCRYRMVSGLYGAWLSDHIVTSTANVIYDTIVGVPTTLNDINETEGGKLDGVEYGATYGAPGNSPVGSSDAARVVADVAAAHAAIGNIDQLTANNLAAINGLIQTYGDTASSAASASAAAQHETNAAAAQANAEAARAGAEGAYSSASTRAGEAETFRNQASTFSNIAEGYASTASEQAGLAASARQTAQDAAYASNTSAGTASAKADAAGQSAQAAQSSQVRASNFALDAAGHATNNIVARGSFDERGAGNWILNGVHYVGPDGVGYVLAQRNRDVVEGDFIPGDWGGRRFRVSGNVGNYGEFWAAVGLHYLRADGSVAAQYTGVRAPHSGHGDFVGEFVMPADAVSARPILVSDGPQNDPGHALNWRVIRIEDITAERAAQDYADAASSSFSNAEIKANEAGQYAQSASGYANTANIRAGNAETAASAASGSAAVATDKAAQAASSATLSAQFVGGGNLALNTEFTGGETVGWTNDQNGAGTFDNVGVNLPGDDWHPENENTLSVHQSNKIGDPNTVTTLWRSSSIPVRVGEWYQVSAYIASHRCDVDVVLAFQNPAGQWTDAVASQRASASGGRDANSYVRLGVPSRQAPPGTVAVTIQVRKYDTNPDQSESWMWLWRPYVGAAREGQTTFNNYSPGSTRGTVESAKARIETVSTAAASATQAVAQRVDTLETSIGGPNGAFARLSTTEQVAVGAAGAASTAQGTANSALGTANSAQGAANSAQGSANTAQGAANGARAVADVAFDRVSGARWSKEAIAGNGRAMLSVYAFDDGSLGSPARAGVDIIGDLTISGDLTVDGTIRTSKLSSNAAQSVQWARTSGQQTLGYNQWTRIIQLGFNKSVWESSIDLYANLRMRSGDDIVGQFRLVNLNNGAVEDSWPIWMQGANSLFQVPVVLNWIASGWAPGGYTLAIDYLSSENDAQTFSEAGSIIKIHEIKR